LPPKYIPTLVLVVSSNKFQHTILSTIHYLHYRLGVGMVSYLGGLCVFFGSRIFAPKLERFLFCPDGRTDGRTDGQDCCWNSR